MLCVRGAHASGVLNEASRLVPDSRRIGKLDGAGATPVPAGGTPALPGQDDLAAAKDSVAARIQKMWTMQTLGTLTPAHLVTALRDSDARVRVHAIRLAENFLTDRAVFDAACSLAGDTDERVRIQLAFSLGESSDAKIPDVIRSLAARDGTNPNMIIALLSSAPKFPSLAADAARWQESLKSGKPVVAPPAIVITNANPDRERIVKSYASAATLTGDAANGHKLYAAICSVCHRLKNEGNEIGPDLSTVAGKPTEQLIEAILDPSRAVEQRYLTQKVTLKNGKEITGLLAEETAGSITLKLGGASEVILKANIARQEAGKKSLMPDGLETVLTPQQLADVLAWLRAK